jgi:hypothetical protein
MSTRVSLLWILLAVALGPTITIFEPRMVALVEPMFVAGFLALGVVFVALTFRRSKLGPAALWADTKNYLTTRFSRTEVLLLCAFVGVVVSAILILLVSALRA